MVGCYLQGRGGFTEYFLAELPRTTLAFLHLNSPGSSMVIFAENCVHIFFKFLVHQFSETKSSEKLESPALLKPHYILSEWVTILFLAPWGIQNNNPCMVGYGAGPEIP